VAAATVFGEHGIDLEIWKFDDEMLPASA